MTLYCQICLNIQNIVCIQCDTGRYLLVAFVRGVVDYAYIFQSNQPPALCLLK
jgi:hypothetical protein